MQPQPRYFVKNAQGFCCFTSHSQHQAMGHAIALSHETDLKTQVYDRQYCIATFAGQKRDTQFICYTNRLT